MDQDDVGVDVQEGVDKKSSAEDRDVNDQNGVCIQNKKSDLQERRQSLATNKKT